MFVHLPTEPDQKFNCPITKCRAIKTESNPIFVGIFFDGTGNNMNLDYYALPPEKRKQSNIVKLYHTHRLEHDKGYFSHYIPGVGTEFDKVNDRTQPDDYVNFGSIGAEMAADRISWAFTRLLNAPHQFAHNNLQLISDADATQISNSLAKSCTMPQIRWIELYSWQQRLKASMVDRKRQVSLINLSVFGFSRGAAQARVFVNWLFETCAKDGNNWTFAGIPISLQFLGIFDTVASVGLTDTLGNGIFLGHQSWADNSLQIHPAVKKCVHYVAGHEVRASFPLDSVRVKNHTPPNAVEKMYPGSHSDVGGGYAPGALGVSPKPEDSISTIPGADMYNEACNAGVPLLPWDKLNQRYRDALTPSAETLAAYRAYCKDAAVDHGTVEHMHRQHMALFFSHRFKHRRNFTHRKPYVNASDEHKLYLLKTQANFMHNIKIGLTQHSIKEHNLHAILQVPPRPGISYIINAPIRMLTEHLLSALDVARDVARSLNIERLTPSIEFFFENYIHDSMAGFMERKMDEYKWNSLGLAKFRTILSGND